MAAKLKSEYINSFFEQEGYTVIADKCCNGRRIIDYICPNGHKHNIRWDHWKDGQRCPHCLKAAIEFIKSEFEKEDYILLSTKYINYISKLKYICPEGHEHQISWDAWKNQNQRCPYCAGNAILTIEFIRAEFVKEKYKLLTKKYENAHEKLECICSKGHKYKISWAKWKSGYRCSICSMKELSAKYSGSGNPAWKGGIACEPYCPVWLDKEFKRSILERDGYKCQNPDCWGTGNKLIGHHIDYNKKNCDPSNVITLCNSCNSRANGNREYWTKFYLSIMNKKYGYVYERVIGQSI